MRSSGSSSATRLLLPALLALAAIGLWLFLAGNGPGSGKPGTSPESRPQPKPAGASSGDKRSEMAHGAAAPMRDQTIRVNTKGKVRLKPGESAVLGYWEIAPGMNGLAIVAPETLPDGSVKLAARILHMSDQAVKQAGAQDLFPDIFEPEHYGAVDRRRMQSFLEAVQPGGAEVMTTPTIVTNPGAKATINLWNGSGGASLRLGLQADPLENDAGYDLSLEFERQGMRTP